MITAAVITVSDKGSRGEREDVSGPALGTLLSEMGAEVVAYHIIPDERDEIMAQLVELADEQGIDLIMTTGGTGPSPRDVTPEATRVVIEREMPGLTELMRLEGYRKYTSFAALSRAVAGIRGKTLIVNLPGNPQAVRESMEILGPLLPATVALVKGEAPPNGINDPSWATRFGKGRRRTGEWLEMYYLSSAEGGRFAQIANGMTERIRRLSPNPLRGRMGESDEDQEGETPKPGGD